MANNKRTKGPMTHQQKIDAGFELIGKVGGQGVYLTPAEIRQIKQGVSDRAKLIAFRLETARKRAEGDAESNGPVKPELTDAGNCLIKATGVGRWATFGRIQLEKMFSKEGVAMFRAFLKSMPVVQVETVEAPAVAASEVEDDE